MVVEIEIAGRKVGPGHPCFLIAEAGVNHNGSLARALQLVEIARAAGADAVKFQLFRVEEQISRAAPVADYQRDLTGAQTMHEMAHSYDLPWEAHRTIAAHCRQSGIAYMASCFDSLAVDFFLELGGDAVKVGAGEITNYPLLAHIAATGRPILLSTGMSTLQDVAGAVEYIRAHGASPLALFQCVSNYPADPATVNLRVMQTLMQSFGVPVGFSDHTLGNTIAIAAAALGAHLIEKHFTSDKTLPGPDHPMSLDAGELRAFVAEIRTAESALGSGIKRIQPGEMAVQRVARRSLVSAGPIHAGETLSESNVTLKRPATGIDPRFSELALGRTARIDIPADTPITWEMLS
jgi:N,N'-diacetyllegionaminate synthase